jgi:hypothetical protein
MRMLLHVHVIMVLMPWLITPPHFHEAPFRLRLGIHACIAQVFEKHPINSEISVQIPCPKIVTSPIHANASNDDNSNLLLATAEHASFPYPRHNS